MPEEQEQEQQQEQQELTAEELWDENFAMLTDVALRTKKLFLELFQQLQKDGLDKETALEIASILCPKPLEFLKYVMSTPIDLDEALGDFGEEEFVEEPYEEPYVPEQQDEVDPALRSMKFQ